MGFGGSGTQDGAPKGRGGTDPHRPPPVVAVSERAVLVRLATSPSPASQQRVAALVQALDDARPSWLVDCVPAYATVLVVFDPQAASIEQVRRTVRLAVASARSRPDVARRVVIPVWYDPRVGPDLEEVARLHGLSVGEVVARHTGREYLVYALGFKPGFPYLGFVDDRLVTPRLATPRVTVPAGSVGIAGRQTGIYPVASPGGWRILGRTPLAIFDPASAEPFRLRPGDRVRFEAIDEGQFAALAAGGRSEALHRPQL